MISTGNPRFENIHAILRDLDYQSMVVPLNWGIGEKSGTGIPIHESAYFEKEHLFCIILCIL